LEELKHYVSVLGLFYYEPLPLSRGTFFSAQRTPLRRFSSRYLLERPNFSSHRIREDPYLLNLALHDLTFLEIEDKQEEFA
jgi:hypothetical protein